MSSDIGRGRLDRAVGPSSERRNLVDTPLFVDHNFIQCGWMPVEEAMISNDGQIVDITGGGSCGWTTPEPCTPTPQTGITNIKLQLGYVGN